MFWHLILRDLQDCIRVLEHIITEWGMGLVHTSHQYRVHTLSVWCPLFNTFSVRLAQLAGYLSVDQPPFWVQQFYQQELQLSRAVWWGRTSEKRCHYMLLCIKSVSAPEKLKRGVNKGMKIYQTLLNMMYGWGQHQTVAKSAGYYVPCIQIWPMRLHPPPLEDTR